MPMNIDKSKNIQLKIRCKLYDLFLAKITYKIPTIILIQTINSILSFGKSNNEIIFAPAKMHKAIAPTMKSLMFLSSQTAKNENTINEHKNIK